MDASQQAGIDAAIGVDAAAHLDAATDAAVLVDAATDSGNPAPCAGQQLFGLCWYLTANDTSCNAACSNKGGFDSRALSYIGIPSQGGSQPECQQIFAAL